MGNAFVQYDNIVPLLAPQDIAAAATATPFVDMRTANDLAFLIAFGSITAASADQAITVTVEAATAGASGSEAAVAFNYRLSGAVGANTWGAITAATTAGVSIATTDDNKLLWIEIDPAAVLAAKADARYVRAVVTPDAGGTATLVQACAIIDAAYKQTTMVSVS